MKNNRNIFIFTLLCAMLIVMMAQPVFAHGEELSTSARSAVVIDSATGAVMYEQNSRERLPMASTTKIMTALIAIEHGDLDREFTVDSNAIKVEGSSMGLREGDRVTMRTLVCGMLLPSGNDAANAAAVRISGSIEGFVRLMNERAAELGLEDTHFVTPSGLDDYTDEHYSTAYDMARLAAYAMRNDEFKAICSQQSIKVSFGDPPSDRWLTNTNRLLGSCEGIVGVKTGFTDKARRCLVSACERKGARLICVTLNDPDDWRDHAALYDSCFSRTECVKLPASGRCFDVPVAGGSEDTVSARSDELNVTIPKGIELETKVCLAPFAAAPVRKGEQLGSVMYYLDGRLIKTLPVKAEQSVTARKREKNEWKKLLIGVEKLLERFG